MSLEKISNAILDGRIDDIEELVKGALVNYSPDEIINNGLIKGMDIVGKKFKDGDYFLPEVMISSETMHKALKIIKPLLEDSDYESEGRIIIGTVRGDLHDIGKNLVSMMLVGAGFDVVDLGIDVSPNKFSDAVVEHKPKLLCMSALLTTTMPEMEVVISKLKELDLRHKVKVMVGGAPVTQKYAEKIGSDGYAVNAAEAVEKAKILIK